jgi:2,4-dienoyl-CoA reductase-like NADH-dependent reductase (Old Yellow Enzyme family)/thioredoxin reductase
MKSKFKKLFEPIQINKMTLRNRTVALAGICADTVKMFGGVSTAEKVAKGGVGLVVTVMADVDHPKSNFYPGSQYTLRKSERNRIRDFVSRIHQYGAKYMLEIDHVGEYYRADEGDFSLGTANKINEKGIHVKQMDEKDMEEISKAFCKTAKDAIELGFDAILFDCAGGWLISQFLVPYYNKRTDEYGGPIENRIKFPLRVLKDIRNTVGKDFPIMLGVSVNEFFDIGSNPFEDVITFIKMMQPYADGVLCGCGNDQTRLQMTKGVSTNLEDFMMIKDYTKKLKEELDIPVVLTNGIMRPEDAEEALEKGWCDMVGMCRPFIADHDWVDKARDNKEEDITPCLRCNQCFHVSTDIKHVACSVNPYYTQMQECHITPIHPEKPKNIVIVGAGPAGIRAALAAYDCGHHVTLLEKEKEVGGLLRYISKEKHKTEIARYFAYLKYQLNKRDIKVITNCNADKDYVTSLNPDKVIIAIGAKENTLNFPSNGKTLKVTEAIENSDKIGDNVVMIGGGVVGVELALEYAEAGKKVSIVELTNELAINANLIYRPALLDRIEHNSNITVYKNAKAKDVSENQVVIEKDEKEIAIDADTVILSIGFKPKYDEAFNLFNITENTVVVGDADKTGNIVDATFSGHTAGVNF